MIPNSGEKYAMLRSGEPPAASSVLEPGGTDEHVVEATLGRCDLVDEVGVVGEFDPAGRLGPSDQVGRVLPRAPPGLVVVAAVDAVEDRGELAIPRPVQVGGETRQGRQRLGNLAGDRELVGGTHRRRSVTARYDHLVIGILR